jgi:hypothetical protein
MGLFFFTIALDCVLFFFGGRGLVVFYKMKYSRGGKTKQKTIIINKEGRCDFKNKGLSLCVCECVEAKAGSGGG